MDHPGVFAEVIASGLESLFIARLWNVEGFQHLAMAQSCASLPSMGSCAASSATLGMSFLVLRSECVQQAESGRVCLLAAYPGVVADSQLHPMAESGAPVQPTGHGVLLSAKQDTNSVDRTVADALQMGSGQGNWLNVESKIVANSRLSQMAQLT
jgi:hypothetical protein